MLEASVFWITFIPEKLMPPDKLISPKPTVLRHFPASDRRILWFNRNTRRISGFFLQTERISRPNAVKVIPPRLLLALWRTVTARVPVLRPDSERCTMERVSRLVGPMCNRGISLQIRRYCQGRKVCRLKSGRLCAIQTGDIARQSRASNRKHSKKLGNITLTFLAYYLIFFPL